MKEKIAVVVDSGSDIDLQLQKQYNIFSLPLRITIEDKEYIDGVDITREELFAQIDADNISTSLPSGEDILKTFENLKKEGYTHVIAVTISSGLSGTHNVIQNLTQEIDGLETFVLDTKNISLASGYLAIEAAKMIEEGQTFETIKNTLQNSLKRSKVFFTVGTLDYLIKGGRIGLVAGTVANALNIKPTISCNDDGIYYTVSKTRGYKRVIKRMIKEADEFLSDSKDYTVTIVNANTQEDLDAIKLMAKQQFEYAKKINVSNITPALAIHTGPEALGIAVYKHD